MRDTVGQVLKSWTPGRVNLIGEYVDFNGGHVLPAALPLGVDITLTPSGSDEDRIRSKQFDGVITANINAPKSDDWADYVRGALQAARKAGWITGGYEVQLDSTIPFGSGVSSSAAVSVGVLRAAASAKADGTEIAQRAQQIEHEFIGVPCGIMDQMAVAHAKPGEALALNTRDLSFERLAIPSDWAFAVVHSGVSRALTDGRYKAKAEACLTARDQLGLAYLCDAKDVAKVSEDIRPIACHVVTEEHRTRVAIEAMKIGDRAGFGTVMTAGHRSLKNDFGNSLPQIDALIDTALNAGAFGARLTGAGFGGCIVALVDPDDVERWLSAVLGEHPDAYLIATVNP